jgi:hypothetical protein
LLLGGASVRGAIEQLRSKGGSYGFGLGSRSVKMADDCFDAVDLLSESDLKVEPWQRN